MGTRKMVWTRVSTDILFILCLVAPCALMRHTVILPCDHMNAGHILDDVRAHIQIRTFAWAELTIAQDMHAIMVRPLPVGCRLTVRPCLRMPRRSLMIL
jgi:hypothetical protein